jgi:Spaetzle
MYCRRGCKCEQQHRLHRLLAYNPLDACRGIFSDWFRFPSCCICKCYDIPFDFRVTSRSPRGTDKLIDDDDDNNSSEVEQMDIEVNVETDTDNDSNDGRITFSASDDVDINFYNQDHEDDF